MKWTYNEPQVGDMIRVKLGNIYHYGVYVSDNEVIQFGYPPINPEQINASDVEVLATNVETFLAGGFLETAVFDKKEKKKRISPSETVRLARKAIGTKGYNLIHNNCEHFANQCVFGNKECEQVEEVRNKFSWLNDINVFIYKIPKKVRIDKVYPEEKNSDIIRCTNDNVKIQKYCAWKLLEYAYKKIFDIDLHNLDFKQNKKGKWLSNKYNFSITHTDDYVAVSIAFADHGIDLEQVKSFKPSFANKILTNLELEEYQKTSNKKAFIRNKRTQKEATYKCTNSLRFIPNQIETSKFILQSTIFKFGFKKYSLSICSTVKCNVKFTKVKKLD